MKKITTSDDTSAVSLHKTFWRWLSFSVLALVVAAAIPAFSADVFIDEGDGDFAPTPVSSPAAAAPTAPVPTANTLPAGPAPASENVPPAGPGGDIDSAISQLEPAQTEPALAPGDVPAPTADMSNPMDASAPHDGLSEPAPVKKVKTGKAAASKHLKAVKKTVSKSKSKKSTKTAKKSSKKKDTKAAKKSSKKKSTASTGKSSKKRAVASVGKFAGGQYATTSRACSMESAPGAGDAVGTTLAARKLWVEESGNTSYWKVYGKSGSAAYVSRDCF